MEDLKLNRRRNYFIDKKFQTRFILKFCLVMLATSLLAGLLTYLFIRQSNTVAFENLRVVVKSTADFVLPTIILVFVIVSVIAALVTIAVTMFTSHRISGPLYKLTLMFQKMSAGDLSEIIRIRDKDQLQKVAVAAEELRLSFKGEINALKKNWADVKAVVQKKDNEPKDAAEKQKLMDAAEKIDSSLERFKAGQ